ncbi:MAG TPA: hypothetical protein VF191_16270, partial [Cyclobacteriaceae bacterium]
SEMLQMFRILSQHITTSRFVVITPNSHDEIVDLCKQVNFDHRKLIYIRNPPFEVIRNWLSAADLGVTAIPPTPSQKYRSPTKVAEYLMCGLPYITVAGVSEDDIIATEYDVGVVVKDFSENSISAAIPAIVDFLKRDRTEMIRHCREVGIMYRGKANVDRILKSIFSELERSG